MTYVTAQNILQTHQNGQNNLLSNLGTAHDLSLKSPVACP